MFKSPFLLLVYLFLFSHAFGQNDSNVVHKDTLHKDTNLIKARAARSNKQGDTGKGPGHDSSLPLGKKDTTGRDSDKVAGDSENRSLRKDSTAAKPRKIIKPVKDSLGNKVSSKDSVSSFAGSALRASANDSVARVTQRKLTMPMPQPAPAEKGPDDLTVWKTALAVSWFNFLGKPVVTEYRLHRPNSKDSLFYLFTGILFYFALIRIAFEKYFNNLMTLFFRVSLRQQQIREQVLQTPLPSLLLNLLFIISGGLYACYLLHYSRFGHGLNFWELYGYCMGAIALIYLLKFVVLKFCGWVFNISRVTDTYIFVVFLVNKMLGIFLLPFLILIAFSDQTLREIVITISLTMIFVMLGYRVIASYRPIRSEIKLSPFYFFLYLCAFEIAPLLLIYKVLLSYLEKGY